MNKNQENSQIEKQASAQIEQLAKDGTLSNTSGSDNDKLLAVGRQRVQVNAVTTKIRDDIAFLEDRIKLMQSMASPSETVLNTYHAMLSSRKSVLDWLEQHNIVASDERTRNTGT